MVRDGLGRFPSALHQIAMPHLVALLEPHRPFFDSVGVRWEERIEPDAYDRLVELVLDPASNAPPDLLDALELVLALATPDGMDLLLDEAARLGVEIVGFPDPSPADVATQLFIRNRKLLEEIHSQRFAAPGREMFFFRSSQARLWEPELPPADGARRIQFALDDWFAEHRRGRGVRVTVHPAGDKVEFLIRHAGPVRRVGSVRESGQRTSVSYRPESFDVVVYDPSLREIGISAEVTAHHRLYRRVFGEHLFGDPDLFRPSQKYTLAPLQRDGPLAMSCGDVPGITSAKVIELSGLDPITRESQVFQSRNLFPPSRGVQSLLGSGAVSGARFSMRFSSSRRSAVVSLQPTNGSSYPVGGDVPLLEHWLGRRGFLIDRGGRHASRALGNH